MSDLLLALGPGAAARVAGLTRASPSRARLTATHAEEGFAAALRHHATDGSRLVVTPDDVLVVDGQVGCDDLELRRLLTGAPSGLAKLVGAFAAALYDRRRRTLRVATNRSAMRPVFWTRIGDDLLLSSFVATLAAQPGCRRVLRRQTLLEAVTYQRPLSGTIYRDVHPLPPGTIATAANGDMTLERYFEMRFKAPGFPRREAAPRLAEALKAAIRRAQPVDGVTAILMSGGFDSRVMLAAAREPVVCITQAVGPNREAAIAEAAARIAGIPWRFIEFDGTRYFDDLDASVRITGGVMRPHCSHFLSTAPAILELAPVVLSGWGIDTMFRGNDLPKHALKIAGKQLPVPALRPPPRGDLAPLVACTLKHTLSGLDAEAILLPSVRAERWPRLEEVVRRIIGDNEGYAAWDKVGLETRSMRQTFGDAISLQVSGDLRLPGQDPELEDLFLELPPAWRAHDRLGAGAARLFLPAPLARLPLANTGLPASWPPRLAGLYGLGRLGLERLGLRPAAAAASFGTQHSWPSFRRLLREHPPLREALLALPRSDALAACGLFDPAGLSAAVRAHLAGERDVELLLLMLLAIDRWITQLGADGAAD